MTYRLFLVLGKPNWQCVGLYSSATSFKDETMCLFGRCRPIVAAGQTRKGLLMCVGGENEQLNTERKLNRLAHLSRATVSPCAVTQHKVGRCYIRHIHAVRPLRFTAARADTGAVAFLPLHSTPIAYRRRPIGAQSFFLGGGAFSPENIIYVWKINKMPEFYMIFAPPPKKNVMSEFYLTFDRKKIQNLVGVCSERKG